MSGTCWEALPDFPEWSGDHSGSGIESGEEEGRVVEENGRND